MTVEELENIIDVAFIYGQECVYMTTDTFSYEAALIKFTMWKLSCLNDFIKGVSA